MFSKHELLITELTEIIYKQNKVIEKMAKQLENMQPFAGRAIVNYKGELYDCYICKCQVDLGAVTGRDESGKTVIKDGLRHTFEVMELHEMGR